MATMRERRGATPSDRTDPAASLPEARGPISEAALSLLGGRVRGMPAVTVDDPLGDEDLHLALYACYELHYAGWAAVDEDAEWDPALIAFRRELERPFEAALRDSVGPVEVDADHVPEVLRSMVSGHPSELARYLARSATLQQFREFVTHRSAYHLKEADPHTWAIPRLRGRAKAALVEIQADEYGGGDARRMHSSLFADTMRGLGLDATYGRYIDLLPGTTLATVNLMSMFGLHRRLRGAAVGHLAAFELGSSIPNREYGRGLRRLGFEGPACAFYDEHVEADAVHDMIATYDVAGALAAAEPRLAGEVVFGAAALDLLESRAAAGLLGSWREGRSSLRPSSEPAPVSAGG